MCTMLCPKVFLLDMRFASGPLLWIPFIGDRGAGCLPIRDIVGLGLHVTIPADPEKFKSLRAMGSVVGGLGCCLFSFCR